MCTADDSTLSNKLPWRISNYTYRTSSVNTKMLSRRLWALPIPSYHKFSTIFTNNAANNCAPYWCFCLLPFVGVSPLKPCKQQSYWSSLIPPHSYMTMWWTTPLLVEVAIRCINNGTTRLPSSRATICWLKSSVCSRNFAMPICSISFPLWANRLPKANCCNYMRATRCGLARNNIIKSSNKKPPVSLQHAAKQEPQVRVPHAAK